LYFPPPGLSSRSENLFAFPGPLRYFYKLPITTAYGGFVTAVRPPQRKGDLMAKCVECDADVALGDNVEAGEIVDCPDCGTELEVIATGPVALARAPEEEEDWGE